MEFEAGRWSAVAASSDVARATAFYIDRSASGRLSGGQPPATGLLGRAATPPGSACESIAM